MTATEQIRRLINEAAEYHGFDVKVTQDAYPDYEVSALLTAYDNKLAAQAEEIAKLRADLYKMVASAPPVPTWRSSDFLVGVGCIVKRGHPGYTLEELRASAQAAGDNPDNICERAFAEINAVKGAPQVLVTKRLAGASHGVGIHSIPGGNLEGRDGDPVKGACRELWEETGLRALSGNLLSHCEPGVRNDGQPYITIYVEFDTDNPATGIDLSTLSNPEPDKHADWRWYGADDLPQDMWSRGYIYRYLTGKAPEPLATLLQNAISEVESITYGADIAFGPTYKALVRAAWGEE